MAEEPRQRRMGTQVLEMLSEVCLLGLCFLFVIDETAGSTTAQSLLPAMAGLAVALLVLLLLGKSRYLLVPAGELVVGVTLGLMLSLARSHVAKDFITEGAVPEFFEISWAGIAVVAAAILFLAGAACDGFRSVRAVPYIPAIVIGTLAAIVLDVVLWLAVRAHTEYLERVFLVGFVTIAAEYAALLIIATGVTTDWRKRRLAIYCVLALIARLALEAARRGG